MDLAVARSRELAPDRAELASLYAAAFGAPPLFESAQTAEYFAGLYDRLLNRRDTVVTYFRDEDGVLNGLAYGHYWKWSEQSDEWATALRASLAEHAEDLDGRFAVYLLAVAPEHRGQGLGRKLLLQLVDATSRRAWLITRDEPTPTPAVQLYRALGWVQVGYGPTQSNGKPGLVFATV